MNKLLQDLLKCAEKELSPAPGRVILSPGAQVAWDDCCSGQLWARVIRLEAVGKPSCVPALWKVYLGLGVVRCAATLDDQGRAPTAKMVTADTEQELSDMLALQRAITCCNTSVDATLNWLPVGPNGGCVGGEWTLIVRMAQL